MLKSKEQTEDKSTNTSGVIHYGCLPCKKKICGRPGASDAASANITNEPITCVVCIDLWETLHHCPYCGGDSQKMWGR